ncbi:MAG: TlyA family RNA methyltransferase [Microcella sp.]|uniref:TlyA family RNA methyltransferase n=1 Tax=Microcella sp. TaxID=1913979 RepID=UPI0033147F47
MTTGTRLDVALVERGLARSRTAARAAIEEGRVRVDGHTVVKPAHPVSADAALTIDAADGYVSRAAHKLLAALDAAGRSGAPVQVDGALALDLGASTGGFTQVLLERGARQVIALDVGHGQLDPLLRTDARVVVVEGENARALSAGRLAAVSGVDERPDLVVGDLSFISLTLVLPAIVDTVGTAVPLVLLIKPQFEVGRQGIREGVVRDAGARAEAIMGVLWAAFDLGLAADTIVPSPLPGVHGNLEFLAIFRPTVGRSPTQWRGYVDALAHGRAPTEFDSSTPDTSTTDRSTPDRSTQESS